MKQAAYVAVDWGTSSFRLWLVDRAGNVLAERRSHEGMVRRAIERFQAKACPGLDPGWVSVRVKKTRQNRNLEPRFDFIETEKAPGQPFRPHLARIMGLSKDG